MIITVTDKEVLDKVGRFTDVGEGENPLLATSGHEFLAFGTLMIDEENMTVKFFAVNLDTNKDYGYTVRVDMLPESYSAMFDGSVSWLAIDAEEIE